MPDVFDKYRKEFGAEKVDNFTTDCLRFRENEKYPAFAHKITFNKDGMVVISKDINVLNKKGNKDRELSYNLEITKKDIPIKKGDVIGYLSVHENNKEIYKINVTVDEDVERANILELLLLILWYVLEDQAYH